MKKEWFLLTPLFSLFLANNTFAHPIAFKGSTSFMSMNTSTMNELYSHYSFSPRFSLGAKFVRIEERGQESFSVFPQLSVLLHRWNHPEFQANIYAYGGYGLNRAGGENGSTLFYGSEADIEDRRLYASMAYQGFRLSEFRDHHLLKARIGVAAYEAEYDEPAVWGILQYEWHPGSDTKHSVTPLMRIFYKNALLEAGSSIKGDWLLNFMIHY